MLLKILNALLLIAAIVGGIFTYQASRKHRQLLSEFERLENKVGDLDVSDPSKVHVMAIDTGEDMHFAWRVYMPAGFTATWQHNSGGTSGASYRDSCQFISRVRFYEDEKGRLIVFTKGRGGSGMYSFGDRKLGDLLRGRWDEITVEQLGSDGIAVVEPDEVAVMLRLTLSDELKLEAKQKLNKYLGNRYQKELFGLRFGSDKAFKQAKANTP